MLNEERQGGTGIARAKGTKTRNGGGLPKMGRTAAAASLRSIDMLSSKNASSNHYEVVVIGGGPGGAALSAFLARQGRSCLVLEQSTFPRYHIGESLVPHTHGILDRLGLLPKLKASPFPEKYSVRF